MKMEDLMNKIVLFVFTFILATTLKISRADQRLLDFGTNSINLLNKDIDVTCDHDFINVTFSFAVPFTGVAFPQDYYSHEECLRYISNADTYRYTLSTQTCGNTYQNETFTNVIYVLKNPHVISSEDFIFEFECKHNPYSSTSNTESDEDEMDSSYRKRRQVANSNHHIKTSQSLTVESLQELTQLLPKLMGSKKNASNQNLLNSNRKSFLKTPGHGFGNIPKLPKVDFKIIQGSNPLVPETNTLPMFRTASIVATLDDIHSLYDFYLVNCNAQLESSKKIQWLLDHSGCPTSSGLVNNQRHAILPSGMKVAFASFRVFTLEPINFTMDPGNRSLVTIECEVQLCFHKCMKRTCENRRKRNSNHRESDFQPQPAEDDGTIEGQVFYDDGRSFMPSTTAPKSESGDLDSASVKQHKQHASFYKNANYRDSSYQRDPMATYGRESGTGKRKNFASYIDTNLLRNNPQLLKLVNSVGTHQKGYNNLPMLPFEDQTMRISAGFGVPEPVKNPNGTKPGQTLRDGANVTNQANVPSHLSSPMPIIYRELLHKYISKSKMQQGYSRLPPNLNFENRPELETFPKLESNLVAANYDPLLLPSKLPVLRKPSFTVSPPAGLSPLLRLDGEIDKTFRQNDLYENTLSGPYGSQDSSPIHIVNRIKTGAGRPSKFLNLQRPGLDVLNDEPQQLSGIDHRDEINRINDTLSTTTNTIVPSYFPRLPFIPNKSHNLSPNSSIAKFDLTDLEQVKKLKSLKINRIFDLLKHVTSTKNDQKVRSNKTSTGNLNSSRGGVQSVFSIPINESNYLMDSLREIQEVGMSRPSYQAPSNNKIHQYPAKLTSTTILPQNLAPFRSDRIGGGREFAAPSATINQSIIDTNLTIYLNTTNIVRLKLKKTFKIIPATGKNFQVAQGFYGPRSANISAPLLTPRTLKGKKPSSPDETICFRKVWFFVSIPIMAFLVVLGVALFVYIKNKCLPASSTSHNFYPKSNDHRNYYQQQQHSLSISHHPYPSYYNNHLIDRPNNCVDRTVVKVNSTSNISNSKCNGNTSEMTEYKPRGFEGGKSQFHKNQTNGYVRSPPNHVATTNTNLASMNPHVETNQGKHGMANGTRKGYLSPGYLNNNNNNNHNYKGDYGLESNSVHRLLQYQNGRLI